MSSKILSSRATPPKAPSNHSRLSYLPALDGLRALAVLAVLFYHADVLWLPGGFLGVEIFFVVSGYLITSLLLAEYRAHNSVSLKNFWQRRARRLLPALFALLGAVLIYAVMFLPEEVASLRADVLAAFAYVTNWYMIFAEQSYFQEMGRPSLLRHLWSLAVEEQFYLLWPLIFVFVLTRWKPRAAMLVLMFGATISALWMGAQFQPDADPSRIYYGTDTRAAGLLIGAALAFVKLASTGNWRKWALEILGAASLGVLIAACLFLSEFDPFLYQGGMLVVAAATALVIASVVAPTSPLMAPVLGFGVLRWVGLRSYSLYLWHWPVFMVTRPQLDTTLEGTPLLVLRFALTFALAEISFRLVESPLRNGALGKVWNQWTQLRGARRWLTSALAIFCGAYIAVGAYALANAVIHAQPMPEPDFVLMLEEQETVSDEPSIAPQEQVIEESETSSEFSRVSYIILEDEEPVHAPAPESAFSYPQDSWLRSIVLRRARVTNPLQADAENWRLRRAETNTFAKTNRARCSEQCQQRLELAELKSGIVRPATPAPKPIARKTAPPARVVKNPVAQSPVPPRNGPAPILAIGDSVMLGAIHSFRQVGLDVDVDAKLGRQVSAAIKLLRARQQTNSLAPIVVIHLGNNGTFSAKQFDEMMSVLRDVPRVIFLTTKVPRKWQAPNNLALAEGVKKYPKAMLVDWNGLSHQHAEYFWKDGIHLRPEGARVYANLIAQVVRQASP